LLSRDLEIKIYRPVVLRRFVTSTLALRKAYKMEVFENRVLRTIFGPKRDEVIAGLRKLHNRELNKLYSL
jgi:hypothetical protein